jgi:hypothetical protein
MMKRSRSVTVVLAALLPVVLLTFGNGCSGCKKDDDDKPAASASAPPPAPTPVTPATVAVEEPDAGSDAGDAGVDAARPIGPGGGSGSIAKCCAALQQNVNSAPLDQKPYYMMAASQCNGLKNTSSGQQAFAQLRSYLQGAKMPGACK